MKIKVLFALLHKSFAGARFYPLAPCLAPGLRGSKQRSNLDAPRSSTQHALSTRLLTNHINQLYLLSHTTREDNMRFCVDLAPRVETLVKTSKRRQNAKSAPNFSCRTPLDANNALETLAVKRTRSVARPRARIAERREIHGAGFTIAGQTRKTASLGHDSNAFVLRGLQEAIA